MASLVTSFGEVGRELAAMEARLMAAIQRVSEDQRCMNSRLTQGSLTNKEELEEKLKAAHTSLEARMELMNGVVDSQNLALEEASRLGEQARSELDSKADGLRSELDVAAAQLAEFASVRPVASAPAQLCIKRN